VVADWLERNRVAAFLILLNIATVGALVFWFRRPQPSPVSVQLPTAAAAKTALAGTKPAAAMVRVYVCGEVAYTDVYSLAQGAIIKDALMAAGGPTGQADLTPINMAQEVQDGDQICVPAVNRESSSQPPVALSAATPAKEPARKININKASYEEIQTLPGIGPTYARAIVEYRKAHGPFQTIEDLEKVKGIGPATVERVRNLITLR
jgi:competence protein ComEA